MLKMVDGTGIIGVDMICPLGVSTPQPPNYDRVELEGTGILVLPNSLDAPLERLELGGKTEQVQTTGKNLLPDKFSIYAEGKSKINLKLQIGNYVYSSKTSKNLYILHEDKSNITNGWTATNKFNFKIDKEETIEVRIETENPLEILPMIRKETESDSYEPYTGGKPSPSPEYPQEIKSVGRLNEDTGKYEVDVKVTGKNLFDKRLLEGGEVVEFNGVECYKYIDNFYNFKYKGKFENGQQYAFTLRILRPASKESNITDMVIVYTDGSMKQMRFSHGELKTFVSDNGKTIDYFSGAHNFSINCYLDLSVTRLSVGGQDAGYEPYQEQTLTLTSDRPITKWDRLVEQGGQIGWLYKHKIIEDFSALVKGTEPIYGNDGGKYFSVSLQNASLNYDRSKIYSEVGVYGKDNKIHYIPQPMMANAIIHVSDTDTIMTAKEHMHYKVIYETIESQFVPLPQSEQNAIRALKTYYPTTVITADGGEVDPDIKVTYRKEI